MHRYARVAISISGYAIVGGETDDAILEAVQSMGKDDFDWERVDSDVLADATIVDYCGPNGEEVEYPDC